jgi:hypothetical protein
MPINFKSIPHAMASLLFVLLQIPLVFMRSKSVVIEARPDRANKTDALGFQHSELIAPVGRFTFLLRVLLVAVCGVAFYQLGMGANSELAAQGLGLVCLIFGLVWLFDIDGRLMDAGLPHTYSTYYGSIVALVSFLPFAFKLLTIPQALALFVFLQVPTVFIQSKPGNAAILAWKAGHEETMRKRRLRRSKRARRVSHDQRVSFTVSVFLIAVFLGILNTLRAKTNSEIEALVLGLFSLFLGFVWFILLKMRLDESGLSHWHKNTFLFVLAACFLPYAYRLIDFRQALALFVVLQIPLLFIRNKQAPTEFATDSVNPEPVPDPVSPEATFNEASPEVTMGGAMLADEETPCPVQDEDRPNRKQIGPWGFLYGLSMIACFWLVLIRLDDVSGYGLGVWVARMGYAVLSFFWFGLAGSRFKDAGLFDGRFGLYWIAVSGVSLLPLMLGFTNGYESLAIFVLIQIPMAFLRSKPAPEEPLQASADSVEKDDALRDFAERRLAEITNESGLASQQRRPAAFVGASFGRAKRVPRWRRF